MRRFMLSVAVVAATVLSVLVPAVTAQAKPAPLGVSWTGNIVVNPIPPLSNTGCTLAPGVVTFTVTGIKGKATDTVIGFASQNGVTAFNFLDQAVTRADNGMAMTADVGPSTGVPLAIGPVSFNVGLFNASGTLIAQGTAESATCVALV